MSMVFADREAAYPHKYKVIPDDGSDSYYVVLERADEPLTPGTPLNAETFNNMVGDYEKLVATHEANKDNIHGVTAAQVGLGNVPNVSTDNQTPTHIEADELTHLISGEKLSVAFGKIAKGISDLISHIANKANPHTVTYEQTGAAPAGYGLGGCARVLSTFDELLTCQACGYYFVNAGAENAITIDGYSIGYAYVNVYGLDNGSAVVQEMFVFNTAYKLRRTVTVGGAVSDWEWDNPPMVLGVGYRTTERWNGKAVYAKLIDFGALPNADYSSVNIGVNASKVVGVNGLVKSSEYSEPFPPIASATGAAQLSWWISGVELNVKTLVDMSTYTAIVIIKYTKD